MFYKVLLVVSIWAISVIAGAWYIEHERARSLQAQVQDLQVVIQAQDRYQRLLEKVTGACEASLVLFYARLGLDKGKAAIPVPMIATIARNRAEEGYLGIGGIDGSTD